MPEKRRDMDLVRSILFEIEDGREYFETIGDEAAFALGDAESPYINDAAENLENHLWLLENSNMVEFLHTDRGWEPFQITWKGHDFLDSVRDPEIWQKTKDGAKAAGGFTVELLGDIAKGLIKTQIKRLSEVDV